jgi:hypothetical protein
LTPALAQISSTPNTRYVIAGGTDGSADGVGPAAQFRGDLYGVMANPDGNLYVVDGSKCTVRKISPCRRGQHAGRIAGRGR